MSANYVKILSKLSDKELANLFSVAVKKQRINMQIILDRLGQVIGDKDFLELIEIIKNNNRSN